MCNQQLSRMLTFLRKITVEPHILFFTVSTTLRTTCLMTLIYERVCMVLHNSTVCSNLTHQDMKEQEVEVQKLAAVWMMYDNVAYTLLSAIVVLPYGAWSDHFSRKYPLLLCPLGTVLCGIADIINVYNLEAPLGFLLLGSLCCAITGGLPFSASACLSYVAAVCKLETLTLRMSFVSLTMVLSYLIGNIVSGPFMARGGYIAVFAFCMGLSLLAMIYDALWLQEVKPTMSNTQNREANPNHNNINPRTNVNISAAPATDAQPSHDKNSTVKEILDKMFKIKYMYEAILIIFRVRSAGKRRRLLLLLIIASFMIIAGTADAMLKYLFVRHPPLSWNPSLYGYFIGYDVALSGICLLVVLPLLSKVAHMEDSVLILAGIVSNIVANIMMGVSTVTWMVFIEPLCDFMAPVMDVCIRSLVSKTVQPEEFGQVFAVLVMTGNLFWLCSGSLYNMWLYPATLTLHPGFCFFLSAVVLLLPLAMAVYLHKDIRRWTTNTISDEPRAGGCAAGPLPDDDEVTSKGGNPAMDVGNLM